MTTLFSRIASHKAAAASSRKNLDSFLDKLLALNGMGCACATDTMHAQQPHPQTTATAQDRRTPGSQPAPSPVAPAAAAPVFTEEQDAFGAWLEGEAETDTKGGA